MFYKFFVSVPHARISMGEKLYLLKICVCVCVRMFVLECECACAFVESLSGFSGLLKLQLVFLEETKRTGAITAKMHAG